MGLLPSELVDYIIDHLHNDRCSLRNCSLVNSGWLISSWFHLFDTLYIKVKAGETTEAILGEFDAPPRFHAYVRTLQIEGYAFKPNYPINSRIDETRIIHTYNIFPYVRTYIISGFQLARVDITQEKATTTPQEQIASSRVLSKLILADVDMDSGHLIRLLSSLRPIREIHFLTVTVSGIEDISPDDPDSDTIPPLGLRSATFETCDESTSFTIASFYKHFPHLTCDITSLDVDFLSATSGGLLVEERIEATGLLINEIGPRLTDLRLDLLFNSDYYSSLNSDSLWKTFNLTHCTSLRTLWISFEDDTYHAVFTENPLLSLIPVLAASMKTFQRLTLVLGSARFSGPFPRHIQVALPRFESFMLSLPLLQFVTFVDDSERADYRRMAEVPEPISSKKRNWLIENLPALYSKGILQIPAEYSDLNTIVLACTLSKIGHVLVQFV